MEIRAFESYMYVEVHLVTETKNGAVYKTKHLGYAKRSRPEQANEIYCPISTHKFINGVFNTPAPLLK